MFYVKKKKLRHDIFLFNNNNINKKWSFNYFTEIHAKYLSKNEAIKDVIIDQINNNKDISEEKKKYWTNKINEEYLKNKIINQQLL